MNDDQFEDLKQIIETTAANTEANLKKELATKKDLHSLETRLVARMDDGFAGAGDAATTANDDTDKRLDELENRVDILEQAA